MIILLDMPLTANLRQGESQLSESNAFSESKNTENIDTLYSLLMFLSFVENGLYCDWFCLQKQFS